LGVCLSATVIITILQNKDTDIVFQWPWSPDHREFKKLVPEGEPTGPSNVILRLVATDPRTGQQLRHFREVDNSDPNDYFSVTPDTGKASSQEKVLSGLAALNNKGHNIWCLADFSRIWSKVIELIDFTNNCIAYLSVIELVDIYVLTFFSYAVCIYGDKSECVGIWMCG